MRSAEAVSALVEAGKLMLGAQAHCGLAVRVGVDRFEEGFRLLILVNGDGDFATCQRQVEIVEVVLRGLHQWSELRDVGARLVQIAHLDREMGKIFE
jgi:hypothetical protein